MTASSPIQTDDTQEPPEQVEVRWSRMSNLAIHGGAEVCVLDSVLHAVDTPVLSPGPGPIVVHRTHTSLSLGGGLLPFPSPPTSPDAVTMGEGTLKIERTTVLGFVDVFALDASECIFVDDVEVTDRFQGCVRYSRVTSTSVLPRRHRVVEDVDVRFVTLDRDDPAHVRLAEDCDPAILRGAEDTSEMGAFHDVQAARRAEGLARRLAQSTPAGLRTGIPRLD